ncbi:hotdog fold domain-containing protein [Simiduia litorea]|uniref:DUF4442 domain-containing protein n=1 Tax=Simiduia litorea TaxID=1435348 RepID=UPI0036F39CA3
MKPDVLRRLLNWYGPYLGAGVKVTYMAKDWRECHVELKLRWYNKNYMGSHFGGSLYSMVDPQYMLMLIKLLGPDYIVWDKAAHIEYIKPGRSRVHAKMSVSDEALADIRHHTEQGDKYLPEFSIDVIDEEGVLVAKVLKTLYVRRKLKM